MEYIAHLKENGETQLLEDHLKQTAELAASFGKNIGLEEAAYAAGMLHDDGNFRMHFRNISAESIGEEWTTPRPEPSWRS